jgi:hypothetical protein
MKTYLLITLLCLAGCNNSDTTSTKYQKKDTAKTDTVLKPGSVSSSKMLIIPGKSISLISLNENAEKVFQLLGKPDSADAAMGKSLVTWKSKSGDGGSGIASQINIFFSRNMGADDEASKVKHVRITSPDFYTAENVHIGSQLNVIMQHYPLAKQVASYTSSETNKQVIVYDDIHKGIAFETDHNNRCIGITVHEPDKKAFETYISFFRDIKFF